MRYLDWGALSSEASTAAAKRAAAVHDDMGPLGGEASLPQPPPGGTVVDLDPNPLQHPMIAGSFSGYGQPLGRRVSRPPTLFPLKVPKDDELGLEPQRVDTSDARPLHIKKVGSLNWEELFRI